MSPGKLSQAAAAMIAVLLLGPPPARASQCDELVECGAGRKLQRCSDCSRGTCDCWFKRTGDTDVDCKGCQCDETAAALVQWCSADAPPAGGLGCSSSAAAGAWLAALGLLTFARRRSSRVDRRRRSFPEAR